MRARGTPMRNFRLDDELWAWVLKSAEELDLSASEWIRLAVRERLDRQSKR